MPKVITSIKILVLALKPLEVTIKALTLLTLLTLLNILLIKALTLLYFTLLYFFIDESL